MRTRQPIVDPREHLRDRRCAAAIAFVIVRVCREEHGVAILRHRIVLQRRSVLLPRLLEWRSRRGWSPHWLICSPSSPTPKSSGLLFSTDLRTHRRSLASPGKKFLKKKKKKGGSTRCRRAIGLVQTQRTGATRQPTCLKKKASRPHSSPRALQISVAAPAPAPRAEHQAGPTSTTERSGRRMKNPTLQVIRLPHPTLDDHDRVFTAKTFRRRSHPRIPRLCPPGTRTSEVRSAQSPNPKRYA